jgi:hypothetical protein
MRLSKEGREKLERKFEEFKKVKFPKIASSAFPTKIAEKEAAHLHLDLVEYDSFIASFVSRLYKGQDVDPEKVYINGGLKHRLEDFGKRCPEALSFVEGHLSYLDNVHRLIRASKGIS